MLLLSLSTLVYPDLCRAQIQDRKKAKVLFEKGNELRWKKDFLGALKMYERAYKYFPSYKILLNMGLTLQDTGRHTEAAAFFERFIHRGRGQSPEEMVRLAKEQLAKIRTTLSRLWVSCPVLGVLVKVDGKKVGFSPVARWIYLKPGKHLLKFSGRAYKPLQKTVSLAPGQALDLPVRMVPRQIGDRDLRRTPPIPVCRMPASALRQRRTKTISGSVSLALGMALATTAGVLYGLGKTQGDEAYDSYSAASTPGDIARYHEELNNAETTMAVGHGFLALSMIAIGISLYQLLTRPEIPAGFVSRNAGISPGLNLLPAGVARISVGVRF